MLKTRKECREFLDRIEKKYKEKLLLLNYKEESEVLSRQQLLRRQLDIEATADESAEILQLSDLKTSFS